MDADKSQPAGQSTPVFSGDKPAAEPSVSPSRLETSSAGVATGAAGQLSASDSATGTSPLANQRMIPFTATSQSPVAGEDAAPAQPGVIASGPGDTAANVAFSGSVVAPASSPSVVAPADTGDIVLGASPRSKNPRRKFVILGVAAAGAAVVVGLVFLVINLVTPSFSERWAMAEVAFNRYGNFLFFGEDTDLPVTVEYDYQLEYALNTALEEDDQAYFGQLKELFDNFMSKYNELRGSANALATQAVDDYAENFEALYLYATTPQLSSDKIWAAYLEGGEEEALALVAENYAGFFSSGNLTLEEYAGYFNKYVTFYTQLANFYDESGCVKTKEDYDCDGIELSATQSITLYNDVLGIDTNISSYSYTFSSIALQNYQSVVAAGVDSKGSKS